MRGAVGLPLRAKLSLQILAAMAGLADPAELTIQLDSIPVAVPVGGTARQVGLVELAAVAPPLQHGDQDNLRKPTLAAAAAAQRAQPKAEHLAVGMVAAASWWSAMSSTPALRLMRGTVRRPLPDSSSSGWALSRTLTTILMKAV